MDFYAVTVGLAAPFTDAILTPKSRRLASTDGYDNTPQSYNTPGREGNRGLSGMDGFEFGRTEKPEVDGSTPSLTTNRIPC